MLEELVQIKFKSLFLLQKFHTVRFPMRNYTELLVANYIGELPIHNIYTPHHNFSKETFKVKLCFEEKNEK